MIIGYEAKRIFHNSSGLGNYGRDLLRILSTYVPGNRYLLYNPSAGPISFGSGLINVEEKRPPIKGALYANYWRQRLLSKRAFKDGVKLFHGLSQEIPIGLRRKGMKSILSVHDLIFIRFPHLYKAIDRKIYTQKVKRACDHTDLIVATSEQTKEDLMEFLGIDAGRIKVIYQGCNPLYWQETDDEDSNRVAEKYDLPLQFVLFVGTLEERKGVDKILWAAKQLDLPLVMIGRKTTFWKNIKNEIDHKQLYTPVVHNNKDLRSIYRKARFFVYPSIFEGFGIPVLEAQVNRVPLITSNTSSLKEIAGPDAITVDPENREQLMAAMGRLWEDDMLQKKMVSSGYKFAETNFTDQTIAHGWKQIYNSMNN